MEHVLQLRRFLEASPRNPATKPDMCELCGALAGEPHSHVIDITDRRLMCVCRPCHILFAHPGSGAGRFRSVPDRYVRLAQSEQSHLPWYEWPIPVGIAFVILSSTLGRAVAFYPSPAGATESNIEVGDWAELSRTVPELATMEPDVEALLVCRRRESCKAWIVPVDACYSLVGRIRKTWRGFEGGEQAWTEIDGFFARLGGDALEAHS
jgi:hypothetical protein